MMITVPPAIMNILLRLALFLCFIFAGQSYATTTALSYGYEVNTVQPSAENLNNNGLINPSSCCRKLSFRDSQDRVQARAFFAFAAGLDVPKGTPNEAFHYTDAKWKEAINTDGLRTGSYATPDGTLFPMQASIELALPPNRSLPNAKLRIDLDAMRRDGYIIPEPTRVSNVVKASDGRVYTRPGGGYEMKFDYKIPPQYISIVE